jgi:hypothetical protein
MTRRILAIVVAFVSSIAGHLLVFAGGMDILMRSQQFAAAPPNALAVAGVVAGLLLVALAALTVAISSAGVIALGTAHILFSLILVLMPVTLFDGGFYPAWEFINALGGLNAGFRDGMSIAFAIGTGFMTGVVLLVAGLLARSRTTRANPVAILVSLVIGILGFVGVLIAISGGMLTYRSMFQMLRGEIEVAGLALLLLGSLLLAVTVATVRWSSAGTIALGAVVVVLSLAWPMLPPDVFGGLMGISRELVDGLLRVSASGLLAIVGVALIGVGVGSSLRARRAAAASTVLAPGQLPSDQAAPVV